MDYSEVRSKIQSGDAILFHGRGPIAWLIRKATRSEFDHVGVAWVVGGRVLVLEARMLGGVQLHALSRRLNDKASWLPTCRGLTEDQLKIGIRTLDSKYSFENAFRALCNLPGRRRRFQCAQLAATIFGFDMTHGWTPQTIRECFTSECVTIDPIYRRSK